MSHDDEAYLCYQAPPESSKNLPDDVSLEPPPVNRYVPGGHYGSLSQQPHAENNDGGNEQENLSVDSYVPTCTKKKGCIIISSIVLGFIVSVVVMIPLILSFVPHTSSWETASTSLLSLSYGVSSVMLSRIRNYSSKVTKVYITDSTLTTSSEILPIMVINKLITSPGRRNYNYYGGDESIYLLPGSNLTYTVSVEATAAPTDCIAQLYLFNNSNDDYSRFQQGWQFNYTEEYCLANGQTDVTFNITEPSDYYVGLNIDSSNVTIISNVSVDRVYYNTTGLRSPSDCPYLSKDNPNCTINAIGQFNPFSCGSDWYIVLETGYSYSTRAPYIYVKECHCRILLLIVCILAFAATPCICACSICLILYCYKCRRCCQQQQRQKIIN